MADPDVERAARFLATHAVLLLGLASVAGVAALAGVAAIVRLVRRHRPHIRRTFSAILGYARRSAALERVLRRSDTFVPSAYLAVHLALGLVLAAAVTGFVVIAEEVVTGGALVTFDLAFAGALRDEVTPGWERTFAAVSWLGEREAIAGAATALTIYLLLTRGLQIAAVWVVAQAGGGLLNLALKVAFERTRPLSADPVLAETSWSFPSGHVMGTFILVGLGCYVLMRARPPWPVADVVAAIASAWCIAMAFSRLYLGQHFFSDVVAGAVAGAAWVAVCASAMEAVRRREERAAISATS